MSKFATAFADIRFEIDWNSESLNAQAFRLGQDAHVRVYGGLARHREIGAEGFALAIAHEIGHHKGGAPTSRHYHWMSTERRADEWAADVGMPTIFGPSRAREVARIGGVQLFTAIAELTGADRSQRRQCSKEQPCLSCRARFFGITTGSFRAPFGCPAHPSAGHN